MGEVHAAAWRVAYRGLFSAEHLEAMARLRQDKWGPLIARLGEADDVLLVARVDARPRAFCYAGPSPARPGAAEIFAFYSHPEAWGSGVAGALMDAVLARLSGPGGRHVHVWTLRDTPQSRRFYAKCGFRPSGAHGRRAMGDGRHHEQVEYECFVPPGPGGGSSEE
ncbi:GNAT family N-acetyltransferase [Nocardiopsis mwathae]|uniref:GNAT family N-acetyltransferase n=1 Tax=Nocardiopsis mwathae TaxID=1472723 RepID=UPI0031B64F0F